MNQITFLSPTPRIEHPAREIPHNCHPRRFVQHRSADAAVETLTEYLSAVRSLDLDIVGVAVRCLGGRAGVQSLKLDVGTMILWRHLDGQSTRL